MAIHTLDNDHHGTHPSDPKVRPKRPPHYNFDSTQLGFVGIWESEDTSTPATRGLTKRIETPPTLHFILAAERCENKVLQGQDGVWG